jgi:hypothetical protein
VDEYFAAKPGVPRRAGPSTFRFDDSISLSFGDDAFFKGTLRVTIVWVVEPERKIVSAVRVLDTDRVFALWSCAVAADQFWLERVETEADGIGSNERVS